VDLPEQELVQDWEVRGWWEGHQELEPGRERVLVLVQEKELGLGMEKERAKERVQAMEPVQVQAQGMEMVREQVKLVDLPGLEQGEVLGKVQGLGLGMEPEMARVRETEMALGQEK
jgi:hypothetical protein